jgi:large subunit ribosomal protein L25
METLSFKAELREEKGSSASRRLRLSGGVPGIVYGAEKDATSISINHKDLFYALHKEAFRSSILNMHLGDKIEQVLLRDFQMHPYKRLVMHIDFQRIDANVAITMNVPLHYSGEEVSPAVKTGGGLVTHVQNKVEVRCLPADLPTFISVDLSKLELGHSIHAKDLTLPEKVSLSITAENENPVLVIVAAAKD